jgi:uncharacterized membrane protein
MIQIKTVRDWMIKCYRGDEMAVLYADHLEELDHALKDAAGRIIELNNTVAGLCEQLKTISADNEALERHFRELNGEKNAIEAVRLLCKSGRMDYDRAEKAESEIARLTAEVARLRKALGRISS